MASTARSDGLRRSTRAMAARVALSACPTGASAGAAVVSSASGTQINRLCGDIAPPTGGRLRLSRREQCVERSPALGDFLQPWILQPAMPIEPDGAIQIAALDQQLGGAA